MGAKSKRCGETRTGKCERIFNKNAMFENNFIESSLLISP